MSFRKRLEKTIDKKEKQIERERHKIEALKEKMDSGKITRADFNLRKKKIEENIRHIDARVRTLHGLIAKDKRHQEEISEEKKQKKEEKLKKKEK